MSKILVCSSWPRLAENDSAGRLSRCILESSDLKSQPLAALHRYQAHCYTVATPPHLFTPNRCVTRCLLNGFPSLHIHGFSAPRWRLTGGTCETGCSLIDGTPATPPSPSSAISRRALVRPSSSADWQQLLTCASGFRLWLRHWTSCCKNQARAGHLKLISLMLRHSFTFDTLGSQVLFSLVWSRVESEALILVFKSFLRWSPAVSFFFWFIYFVQKQPVALFINRQFQLN